MNAGNLANRHGILHVVVAAADAIAGTEGLVITKGRANLRRNARPGSEYGCERPAAQGSSQESRLPLEERRLVDNEHVVEEFAVPGLSSILLVRIEGIEKSKHARGLRLRSHAQSLRPGEVVLQCYSAPIGHLEGNETGVVVTVTNAGVQVCPVSVSASAAVAPNSTLTQCRAGGGNRSTLQGTREVESANIAHSGQRGTPAYRAAHSAVQITPDTPDLGVGKVTAFICHHSLGAV